MKKMMLNGEWTLRFRDYVIEDAAVPGSVYGTLLEKGLTEDPYWRDNELKALELMEEDDCEYSLNFEYQKTKGTPRLRFDGIDTLADIILNGNLLGSTDNMHRIWRFDVSGYLKEGVNELKVIIHSPVKYIKAENEQTFCGGSFEAMEGFPHLRKAHCMFGWDWGPRLPDMGLFRDVSIEFEEEASFESVYIMQEHLDNREVILHIDARVKAEDTKLNYDIITSVKAPDGSVITTDSDELTIENACLWWPNGYGGQPLYDVCVVLMYEGRAIDSWSGRIGLRTMTVNTDRDKWGESFAVEVNGVQIFSMGADYIPQDNILSRITPERTRKLLEEAKDANFNSIRVWGGGYYPEDSFYDICDEMGFVVWQDCMFACASYELDDVFEENIKAEITDNVRRLRHHASLGIWSGNNEMEAQIIDKSWWPSKKQISDYVKIFEYIIPQIISAEDPQTFYWPSSPSSGGNFDNPQDENRGDAHYWDVWHGCKPFTDYRRYCFRYLSEFGFQAFPPMRTIESFTLPEDRDPFSRVMEMHQRNMAANGKIVNYISSTYLYPRSFERFVYISQLLQAEAIRYGVEHFRRNRGRCMGTVVWQFNDIWPVASWSGIDYYGRRKALHFAEKKMFGSVLLSCEEHGEVDQKPFCVSEPRHVYKWFRLNVSNETMKDVSGRIEWQLMNADGTPTKVKGEYNITVPALQSLWCGKDKQGVDITFTCDELYENSSGQPCMGEYAPGVHADVNKGFLPGYGAIMVEEADVLSSYLRYSFTEDGGETQTGYALFAAPKHFAFARPQLKLERTSEGLRVTTDVFTKNIGIEGVDGDIILADNFFDMEPGTRVIPIEYCDATKLRVFTVNAAEETIVKL